MSAQEWGHNGSSSAPDEYTTENNHHIAISVIIMAFWQRLFFITPPPQFKQCIRKSFPRCPIMPSAISSWFESPAGIHWLGFMTGQLQEEVRALIENLIG